MTSDLDDFNREHGAEATKVRLDTMARIIQHWLDWQQQSEPQPLSDDCSVYGLPISPSRRQLKNWIIVLKDAEKLIPLTDEKK